MNQLIKSIVRRRPFQRRIPYMVLWRRLPSNEVVCRISRRGQSCAQTSINPYYLEKERKLEKLREHREKKAAELESLDALDARLHDSKESFETITSRLGKFAAVWGVVSLTYRHRRMCIPWFFFWQIQADLRATEEYLTKAESTATDKPVSLPLRNVRSLLTMIVVVSTNHVRRSPQFRPGNICHSLRYLRGVSKCGWYRMQTILW